MTASRHMRDRRYFDGRVREVVAVRHAAPEWGGKGQRVETLSCGHEKAPSLKKGCNTTQRQYRVCDECP